MGLAQNTHDKSSHGYGSVTPKRWVVVARQVEADDLSRDSINQNDDMFISTIFAPARRNLSPRTDVSPSAACYGSDDRGVRDDFTRAAWIYGLADSDQRILPAKIEYYIFHSVIVGVVGSTRNINGRYHAPDFTLSAVIHRECGFKRKNVTMGRTLSTNIDIGKFRLVLLDGEGFCSVCRCAREQDGSADDCQCE